MKPLKEMETMIYQLYFLEKEKPEKLKAFVLIIQSLALMIALNLSCNENSFDERRQI